MAQIDLTSLLATISFFVCVLLFREKLISFTDFCQYLLMVEGTIFLLGAIVKRRLSSQIDDEFEDSLDTDLAKTTHIGTEARFNSTRWILGLIFFCIGSLIGKLQ